MQILGEGVYVDAKGRRHTVEGIGDLPDDINLQSLAVEGTFSFERISCDTIKVEGECTGDSLTAKNFSVEGTLKVDSLNIEENLTAEGSLKASNIAAAKVSIESRSSSIGEINCKSIKVFHEENFFRKANSRVYIKSIDAETVHLENCAVVIIKCKDAFIGSNCAIEKLFVAGECKVAPDSTVGETFRA